MLRHVLVPLDASPGAESILDRLMPILARPGTDTTLLHIAVPPLAASLDPRAADDARAEAQGYVKAAAKRLSERGVRCRGVVRPGAPAAAILEAAAGKANGMIAMATHARRGLARVAFGSVGESVLRESPVPVLLLRATKEGRPAPLRIRRILVPIDGSALALEVASPVAELVNAFGARVTLVHVLPPKPAMGGTVAHAERVVEEAKALFTEEGVDCEGLIRTGDAAEEIVDAAELGRADLVACTSHGRSGIARAMLGSVAEQVLRTCPVPLLVLRSRA